jgi:DNA transposition AAA+ family ATPase
MKHEMAMTKNVKRFLAAVRELQNRSLGTEGMGLLWGQPGEGKSTTIAYAANMLDGVFLRANTCWSVTSMLSDLMTELGMAPMYRKAPMIRAIVEKLMLRPRPVFIDESDYLFKKADMVDALRDIYDLTGSPVVLIGMEEMARKIQIRGKFARRITQWIEFSGIDAADARTLADTVCEIRISDDLLEYVRSEAKANIGRMTTAMSKIESFGRTNSMSDITLSDWGDRLLFYDQPRFKGSLRSR